MFQLKNIFPQDTRLSELASGFAMLLLALLSAVYLSHLMPSISMEVLHAYHQTPFWISLMLSLGVTQVIAVFLYPHTDLLRVILALVNGTVWCWLALGSNPYHIDPTDAGSFLLGLSNLYAFTVNATCLRKAWAT